jgi:hypothetical protein
MLVNDIVYATDARRDVAPKRQPAGDKQNSTIATHAWYATKGRAQVKARQWIDFDKSRAPVPPRSKCLPPIGKGGPPHRPGNEHRPTLSTLLRNAVREAGHCPPTPSTADREPAVGPSPKATAAAVTIQSWARRHVCGDAARLAVAGGVVGHVLRLGIFGSDREANTVASDAIASALGTDTRR